MYIYSAQKAKSAINLDGTVVNPPSLLSFNFLTTNKLPVWVLNNTRPKGKVILQMTLPNGKTKAVYVERSTLPVCVTDEVGPEMIENGSHDLRSYINKGILTIVWPSDALEMVGTPEAREELQRLRASEFSANNAFVSQRVQDLQKPIEMRNTDLQAGSVQANEINPRVMDFVARFNSNDVQVKDAVGELKVMEDELSEKDLSYIISQIPQGKAKKFAQGVLAQRQDGTAQHIPPPGIPSPNVGMPGTQSSVNNVKTAGTSRGGASEYDVNPDDSDLTPEERAIEAQRAANARSQQRL